MVLIAGALALWQAAWADGLRGIHTRFRDPDLDLATIRARLRDIDQEAIGIVENWPDLGSLI